MIDGAPDARLDDVSVADGVTLRQLGPARALASLAVRLGRTRLIDSLILR